jgi:RNA polymerase sigma factor (sigma-70 family)
LYLYTRVRWRCLNARKKRKREKHSENEYQQWLLSAQDSNGDHGQLIDELLKQVEHVIDKLPERQKEVIRLILAERSTKQIAEQLGIAEQSVRNSKAQGITKLVVLLIKRGVRFPNKS